MYTITIRNHRGTKIAKQIEVDSDLFTIADVLQKARHEEHVDMLIAKWKLGGGRDIRFFWCPELEPKPVPPPPKPEPIGFDVLVSDNMI